MSKFCYEEGELEVADCQCELCIHYNGGARDEVCPREQLDQIIQNLIFCPKLERHSLLDNM